MRGFGSWVAGIAFAVLGVGLGVVLLATPPFTRALAESYSLGQTAGLSRADTLDIVERVRVFVVRGGQKEDLPVLVGGRPGFDASAVSHLTDVHNVLGAARMATVLLALGLGLWIASALQLRERARVALALKVGAGASVILVVLAALAAMLDFSAFFSAFHGLFFRPGTWTFPYDSLLIRLFPEPFWVAAGVAWAALVLLIAGAYWLIALRLAWE